MSDATPELPTSVPRYHRGQPCLQGISHLLVSQDAGAAQRAQLHAASSGSPLRLTHLAQTDHASPAALQRAVLDRLSHASVGLQLHLCGDEAFLWSLHALACQAGLQADEISLYCTGAARRPVYCVHCATIQYASAGEQVQCRHCGVGLEVRRHFSQRLGAYLGVCADAERPYAEVRP